MPVVNLKKHYYPLIKQDTFVEVSEEVAEALLALRRDEERIRSRIRYHKAYYSLDTSDGMENHALNIESLSPEDFLLQKETEAYDKLLLERLEEARQHNLGASATAFSKRKSFGKLPMMRIHLPAR